MTPPGPEEQPWAAAGHRPAGGGGPGAVDTRAEVPAPEPAPRAAAAMPAADPLIDEPTRREVEHLAGGAGPRAVQALAQLLAGNERFRGGRPDHPRQSATRLQEVVGGQQPTAMALSCSDSRVPAEILFDQGIGDLFGQRVAGNVLDSMVLGSIEYAAEHLGVPLLVVLGHSSCGAVAATADSLRTGEHPPGHIRAIVEAIRPAVEGFLADDGFGPPSLRRAELANVRHVAAQVLHRSDIVRELVHEGRLAVVGAFYDLPTGQVSLLR